MLDDFRAWSKSSILSQNLEVEVVFPSAFIVIETVSVLMRVGTASYVIKVIETYLSVKLMYIFRAKRIYLLSKLNALRTMNQENHFCILHRKN